LQLERLEGHLEAAKQTAQQLKESGNTKFALVYMNKFDRWERSARSSSMAEYGGKISDSLSPYLASVESREHSNLSANDMIKAKREIESMVVRMVGGGA
jgi:hypothetical protein